MFNGEGLSSKRDNLRGGGGFVVVVVVVVVVITGAIPVGGIGGG